MANKEPRNEKIGFLLISAFVFIIRIVQFLLYIRGVFQKYAEMFHRMFAIPARLMTFHVKHAWYVLIKYR